MIIFGKIGGGEWRVTHNIRRPLVFTTSMCTHTCMSNRAHNVLSRVENPSARRITLSNLTCIFRLHADFFRPAATLLLIMLCRRGHGSARCRVFTRIGGHAWRQRQGPFDRWRPSFDNSTRYFYLFFCRRCCCGFYYYRCSFVANPPPLMSSTTILWYHVRV